MARNDSCVGGCETSNCRTCGFRDDLFLFILLETSHSWWIRLFQANFASCIWTPLTVHSLYTPTFPFSPYLHPNTHVFLYSAHYGPFHVLAAKAPPLQHLLRPHLIYRVNISEIPSSILPYLHLFTYIHLLSESLRCIYGRGMIKLINTLS